jgi:hypothetical protein
MAAGRAVPYTLAAVPLPDITVAVDLPAAVDEVWAEAARLESHVEWMADAHSIEFLSAQRQGVGTRMQVETRVGPLRTKDVIEVVAWEPPHRIAVTHQGLFQGTGQFLLDSHDVGTRFTWEEQLRFPWFLGGPIGARIARPILAWVWRRNLRRFRSRFAGG